MRKIAMTISLALVLSVTAMAQDRNINVHFVDHREGGTEVSMSLPVSMISSFETQIRDAFNAIKDEKTGVDFFELWAAVREAGPNEYLEVNQEDTKIKVSTTDTHLICNVEGVDDIGQLKVKVPLVLGDALLGNRDAFDYDYAIEVLNGMVGQDLVFIESEEIDGRVWID
jgi:hypothetical protein